MTNPENPSGDRSSAHDFPEFPKVTDPPISDADLAARYTREIRELAKAQAVATQNDISAARRGLSEAERYRTVADQYSEEAELRRDSYLNYDRAVRKMQKRGFPHEQLVFQQKAEVERKQENYLLRKQEEYRERSDTAQAAGEQAYKRVNEGKTRAVAYANLFKNFIAPPPPPVGGGMHQVVYDYDGISAGAAELQRIATVAQEHLDQVRQARLNLQKSSSGAATEESQDRLLQLEGISRRILAAVAGAQQNLQIANDGMAAVENRMTADLK